MPKKKCVYTISYVQSIFPFWPFAFKWFARTRFWLFERDVAIVRPVCECDWMESGQRAMTTTMTMANGNEKVGILLLVYILLYVCVFFSAVAAIANRSVSLDTDKGTNEYDKKKKKRFYKEFHGLAKNFHKFTLSLWYERALTLQSLWNQLYCQYITIYNKYTSGYLLFCTVCFFFSSFRVLSDLFPIIGICSLIYLVLVCSSSLIRLSVLRKICACFFSACFTVNIFSRECVFFCRKLLCEMGARPTMFRY